MRIALVVVAIVLAGLAASARPADAVVRCGTISVPQVYRVRIAKGPATCRTARHVLKVFLTRNASPRGWFCARGHASQSQAWAAACGSRAGAIVRAYGPIRS